MANENDTPTQPMTKLVEKYKNLTKEDITNGVLEEIIDAVYALPGGQEMIADAFFKVKPELFEEGRR